MVAAEVDRQRVLIVEDDDDLATSLRYRLKYAGYDVHTEPDGEGALSFAETHAPDLVVLDLRLPDLDGYRVCQILRGLAADMPIVAYTGLDNLSDKERALDCGATAYLHKGTDGPNELLRIIAASLQN